LAGLTCSGRRGTRSLGTDARRLGGGVVPLVGGVEGDIGGGSNPLFAGAFGSLLLLCTTVAIIISRRLVIAQKQAAVRACSN